MSKQSDWGSDNEPWFEIESFDKILLDKTSILDILDKYGLEYFCYSSGNFTHKLKCPFPQHSNGRERTASLCISEKNNDFHCYGCQSNGNTIDFIMLYLGAPYYKAVEILNSVGNIDVGNLDTINIPVRKKINPEHTIMYQVFRSGVTIKEFLKANQNNNDYDKWCKWATKQFKKLDQYLDTLNDDQWKRVNKYHEKLSEFLAKR